MILVFCRAWPDCFPSHPGERDSVSSSALQILDPVIIAVVDVLTWKTVEILCARSFVTPTHLSNKFIASCQCNYSQKGDKKCAPASNSPAWKDDTDILYIPVEEHLDISAWFYQLQRAHTFILHIFPMSISPPWSICPWSILPWSIVNISNYDCLLSNIVSKTSAQEVLPFSICWNANEKTAPISSDQRLCRRRRSGREVASLTAVVENLLRPIRKRARKWPARLLPRQILAKTVLSKTANTDHVLDQGLLRKIQRYK